MAPTPMMSTLSMPPRPRPGQRSSGRRFAPRLRRVSSRRGRPERRPGAASRVKCTPAVPSARLLRTANAPACETRAARRHVSATKCSRRRRPWRCAETTFRNDCTEPRAHAPHWRHGAVGAHMTASPGEKSVTPSPTASTTPAASWPNGPGTASTACPRRNVFKSVPQVSVV